MVLKITDEVAIKDSECVMTLDEFAMPEMHPFVATTNWEKIFIDLTDKTPKGILRQMKTNVKIVPVIKAEMSPKIMSLLCEIYADEAASLRALYRTNRAAFDEMVKSLVVR